MAAAVAIRTDYTASQLRRLAAGSKHANQARRLLSLAAVLDGASREEAARLGGMDRHTLRDWVHRFNAEGPDGLKDIRQPEPLTTGVPVTLRFSLTPQPVVLKPGERLPLDIASRTDLLRSDVSHGHAQFDMQVPPYYARNTLHYGPDTYIELARAGGSRSDLHV